MIYFWEIAIYYLLKDYDIIIQHLMRSIVCGSRRALRESCVVDTASHCL